MKKIISTLILIAMLAFAALAQGPIFPPNTNCPKGHIETPGFACQPPPQGRTGSETEDGNQNAEVPESVITVIKNLIAEFNPFDYFVT